MMVNHSSNFWENSEEFTIQNGDSGKLTVCELENGHLVR
jgi:hypothetical protein